MDKSMKVDINISIGQNQKERLTTPILRVKWNQGKISKKTLRLI